MIRALTVLGVNILIASALTAVYGLYIHDPTLLGVALSTSLVGAVFLVVGFATSEAMLNSLISYAIISSRALTTLVEDLDLLHSKLVALVSGEQIKLVIAKNPNINNVGVGIGVKFGEPYLSFPVDKVLEGVSPVAEVSERSLELALGEALVESLGICNRVVVGISGKLVRVELYGISKPLEGLCGMPVNPVNVLTTIALARAIGRSVTLVEFGQVVGGRYMVFEVFE